MFLFPFYSFNQLDLPAYETYDKLRSMLNKAVDECPEGFGLAWNMHGSSTGTMKLSGPGLETSTKSFVDKMPWNSEAFYLWPDHAKKNEDKT